MAYLLGEAERDKLSEAAKRVAAQYARRSVVESEVAPPIGEQVQAVLEFTRDQLKEIGFQARVETQAFGRWMLVARQPKGVVAVYPVIIDSATEEVRFGGGTHSAGSAVRLSAASLGRFDRMALVADLAKWVERLGPCPVDDEAEVRRYL